MSRAPLLAVALAAAALVPLAGCKKKDDSLDSDEPAGPGVERTYLAGTSDADGLFSLPVAVGGGVSRFMVTGWTDLSVSLEQIRDPSGRVALTWEDWYDSSESITWAFYEEQVNAANWPIREEDGPLAEGDWEVVFATTRRGEYVGNSDLELAVHRVRDDDLASASVKVRIVWAAGVGDDEHVVGSVESAVERWREIWAQRGLTLVERYDTSALDDTMPWAYFADEVVQGVAASGDGDELMLVVGETFPDGTDTFGISGGLPGSLEATEFKYVAVSWLAHAGRNALFDDDERRLMGETMAHEIGHFMGLFHPVEDGYQSWDALQDTAACRNESACDADLGSNNMYPYPICDFDSCIPQGEVTDDQEGVLQRHVGAL